MQQQYMARVDVPPEIPAIFFPAAHTVEEARAQMRQDEDRDPKRRYGTLFRARLIETDADIDGAAGSYWYFRQGIVPQHGYCSQFFVTYSDRAAWKSIMQEPWENQKLYRCDEVA
jgi:hypothetical protein